VSKDTLRIVSPNGHLGFGKSKPASFQAALESGVDYLIADSGSCDIGPRPLGSGSCASPREWQYHDLEMMVLAARKHDIPMIIGSAGDTGAAHGVDLFVDLVRDIADKHDLPEFRIGYFYSDVDLDDLRGRLSDGKTIEGLDGRADLSEETLDATSRAVAVAGVAPYIELLDRGADIIIGGRSSDCAIFAAPAIRAGFPEPLAYYLGKVLECASFCAEPYAGKESVVGEISHEHVDVTAMASFQRCTPASLAAHSMYERAHPYLEYVAGGALDMSSCRYEQIDERTTRVTGPEFRESQDFRVKLEGSGLAGHRFIGIAGVRDQHTIDHIDEVIAWAEEQVAESFDSSDYELYFHVYGKNAILGDREVRDFRPHEVGIVVESVAADAAIAEEVCMTGTRQLFYARLPDIKGTAGNVSFMFDEVLEAQPAYRWTMNHVMVVSEGDELFDVHLVGSKRSGER
jgi:hypothetical protein